MKILYERNQPARVHGGRCRDGSHASPAASSPLMPATWFSSSASFELVSFQGIFAFPQYFLIILVFLWGLQRCSLSHSWCWWFVSSLFPDLSGCGFYWSRRPQCCFIDIVYFFLFCYTHRFLFFPFRFICPSFKVDAEIREETGDFFLVQAFSAGNFPSGVYTLAAFHEFWFFFILFGRLSQGGSSGPRGCLAPARSPEPRPLHDGAATGPAPLFSTPQGGRAMRLGVQCLKTIVLGAFFPSQLFLVGGWSQSMSLNPD